MENVLLNLLRREKVTSIYSVETVQWKELCAIDIKYIKDGIYYSSRSFATSAWVSKSPLGYDLDKNGNLLMNSFEDVANITSHDLLHEWKRVPKMQVEQLKSLYEGLNSKALEVAKKILGTYSDCIYKVQFLYLPSPSIIVTLMQDEDFLGSLLIDFSGNVSVISSIDGRVPVICSWVKSHKNVIGCKELLYVC